jgi:hypothetical protein
MIGKASSITLRYASSNVIAIHGPRGGSVTASWKVTPR